MKHFTIAELCRTSRAGIDNTPPSGGVPAEGVGNLSGRDIVANLTALIEKVLDPAREAFGAPIRVSSGYRCLALNKAVGGVPSSQHLRGEAADLNTGSREANKRLYEILLAGGQFDQLINEQDYSWIHVSYRRPPAVNRRQAFKLGVIALLLGLLVGCSKVNYLPAARVERVIDTITRTIPDSSALRALFACDSLGRVYVRELTEYKGREAAQEVSFADGELRIETKWRTQYIDRIREVHDTTTVFERVEVERIVKHVPAFFWWTFGIALLAALYLIYKLARKFKR